MVQYIVQCRLEKHSLKYGDSSPRYLCRFGSLQTINRFDLDQYFVAIANPQLLKRTC